MTRANYFATPTEPQRALLAKLARGGDYLYGAEVRVAQRLQRKGLVVLQDNGSAFGPGSNRDHERWFAELPAVPALTPKDGPK